MKRGDEWKIGDVLFMSGDGCYPHMFMAEHLPGAFTGTKGCYSPHDVITRKATVEDAERRIRVQIEAARRELETLQKMFELKEKITSQAQGRKAS